MTRKRKTLEEGIATIDPLAEEDLGSLVGSSNPEELLTAILSTPMPASRKRRRGTAPRASTARWRKPALVAAPVLAVALAVLAIGVPGRGGGSQGIPELAKVAEAAAAQPTPNTGFPYRYEKTREMGIMITAAHRRGWGVFETSTSERWIAGDGSGLERRVANSPKWASPGDREQWEAAGRIHFLAHGWQPHSEEHEYRAGHFASGPIYVAPDQAEPRLAELATDPEELSAWIDDATNSPKSEYGPDGGDQSTERAMTLVTDLLREPGASPALRAALYEALGRIPGIEYFGAMSDAAGRHGIGVGIDSAYAGAPTRYVVIVDPQSSDVLASEEIWLQPPAGLKGETSGQLAFATLFLESRGANSVGG